MKRDSEELTLLEMLGAKLDKDLGEINKSISEVNQRLSLIEALLVSAAKQDEQSIVYTCDGAWTSTVLFKEEEEEPLEE